MINVKILRTIVTDVENLLNNRPSIYVLTYPSYEPLTLSHLLYGRRNTSLSYHAYVDNTANYITHKSINKQFKIKSQIFQSSRWTWKHEHLTSIQEYNRDIERTINSWSALKTWNTSIKIHRESNELYPVVEKLRVVGDCLARSAVICTKNEFVWS